MADALNIQIEIVTPERLIINETATELTIPGKNGYLGILPGHAPLITELGVGHISFKNANGKQHWLAVAWGFAEVLPNKVTIMAEVAEKAEEIDVNRAKTAKQRAEAVLKQGSAPDAGPDLNAAERSLERANNRIALSEKVSNDVVNAMP
jgi:F-type H+-transporting ATPase subunit epsilon